MSKAERKQRWMADFDTAVVAVAPELSGRIDWDTAAHLYYSGKPAKDAGEDYARRRATCGETK